MDTYKITPRKTIHGEKDIVKDKLPKSMYVLFLVLIIDLLGFTVILPLLPSMFDHYSSNKDDYFFHWVERKLKYFQAIFNTPGIFNRALFGGFIGSIFCTLQFLMAPILGSLSDIYGRKPIFILSMVGISLSHAVWSISDYFYIFIIARIIGGLSRVNISLSAAIATDLCSEKTRGKGMALIGIAFAFGFIIGPVFGAYFASRGIGAKFYTLPALFALAMSITACIIVVIFFEESLPTNKRSKSIGHGLKKAYEFISPPSLFSFKPVQHITSRDLQALQHIGSIYFLFLFIYSGLEYSLSFLVHSRFMFTSMQQGKMYLFSGIIMIIVQGGYVRRIPPGKEIKSAIVGSILIIPAFIIIGLSKNIWTLYIGLALYAFASATVVPCLTTLASKFGSSDQKGTILGIFRSLGSLARAFGPMTFGIAYWSLTPTVSYCIGGGLLSIPLYLTIRLKQRLTEKKD